MKKTFSLKLMLLGLFALVSSGAWAQYTAVKGVVYKVDGAKAVVAGVLANLPDGEFGDGRYPEGTKSIQIEDEVAGKKVDALAADWKNAGKLQNDPQEGTAGTNTNPTDPGLTDGSTFEEVSAGQGGTAAQYATTYNCIDATELDAIELVFRASEITEIDKNDIDGLTIAGFILGGTSGIKVIPEGLLAAATSVEVHNDAKDAAIQAANDKINGTTSYVINDGLYNGHQVYTMELNEKGREPATTRYFYVDESRSQALDNGEFSHPATIFSADGKFTPGKIIYWVWVRNDGQTAWFEFQSGNEGGLNAGWHRVGTALGEGDNLGEGHVKGSKEKYEEAKTAKENAEKAVADADEALTDAKYAKNHKDQTNEQRAQNRAKAEALKNAIAVFDGDTYKQKASQVLESNVDDFTAWTTAYTWATAPIAPSTQAEIDAVKNFVKAYQEFFQKDPEALENVTITGITATPYDADGELIEDGTIDPAIQLTTTQSPFLVKDAKEDQDEENAAATEEGMFKVVVLDGTNPYQAGKIYYVKADPTTVDPEASAYYALYTYNPDYDGSDAFEPVVNAQNGRYVVVKFGAAQEFALIPSGDTAPAIDMADPYKAYQTVIDNNKPLSDTDLDKAITDAQAALDEAEDDLEDAQDKFDTAEEQYNKDKKELEDANKLPDVINQYTYNKNGKNEDLYKVAFNNDVVSVGAHAFANCVNAMFTGTFGPSLEEIGEEAFLNTLFDILDLSQTGLADWRGDVDEEGNDIPDGKIDINDRLDDEDIAQDAFVGTPLKKMLLATTDLSDDAIKYIAQNIKRQDDVEFTDECGEIYTRDNINNSLNEVTLPAGEENLACVKVLSGTFQDCIALPAIEFPAQIDAIEDNAFKGCTALATITFAAEKSELVWIGNSAFEWTAATTIDLSAQTKLGTYSNSGALGGSRAFANMKNLQSINFTNTKLTTLPADVFDGDVALATVTFYDATDPKSESTITSLPAGLFADCPIAVLDIAKTKITVLNKLFAGGPQVLPIKIECNGVITDGWADPHNTTLQAVKLPATLQTIKRHALAYMWNENFTTVEIPGNVSYLEEGVFGDDRYLETVSFFNYEGLASKKDFQEGSNLTCLPPNTFNTTPLLKNVYLVTYETLDNDCFGDNLFHSSGIQNTGADKRPNVYVTYESYMTLTAAPTSYPSTYSNLQPFNAVIKGGNIGGLYYKPWTSKMGTWIEAIDEGDNATGVYTAYQNGNSIILYPAKKNDYMGKSYYKIAAYDDDAAMAALQGMNQPGSISFTTGVIYVEDDGDMYAFVMNPFQSGDNVLPTQVTIYRDDNGNLYYEDPFVISSDDEPVIVNVNGWRIIQVENGLSTIPSQIKQLLEERLSFGSFGSWGNFNPPTDVLAKTWMALGVAIVISASNEVPYLQMTNPDHKYQSTLDLANQLSVAHYDIPKALNEGHFYYLAKNSETNKPYFRAHDENSLYDVVPKGSVVFQTTAKQGQGAREFFDVVIVSENEATGINSVTEYISAKDADAIYNLQGVKVAAPQKGQLYIQNGKKFIQK